MLYTNSLPLAVLLPARPGVLAEAALQASLVARLEALLVARPAAGLPAPSAAAASSSRIAFSSTSSSSAAAAAAAPAASGVPDAAALLEALLRVASIFTPLRLQVPGAPFLPLMSRLRMCGMGGGVLGASRVVCALAGAAARSAAPGAPAALEPLVAAALVAVDEAARWGQPLPAGAVARLEDAVRSGPALEGLPAALTFLTSGIAAARGEEGASLPFPRLPPVPRAVTHSRPPACPASPSQRRRWLPP